MWRKYAKVVVLLLCVAVFFRLFLWDSIMSKPMTYMEFEQKLSDGELESVIINKEKGNALVYERETNKVYELKQVSFEKVETLIIEEQQNDAELKYDVKEKSMGLGSFLVCIVLGWLAFKLVMFLYKTFKGIKSLKENIEQIVDGDLDGFDSGSEENEEKGEEDEKTKKKSATGNIEKLVDSLKESIESASNGDFQIRKEEHTNVTFKDVIGLSRELEDLKDIVSFLKDPEKYKQVGAELPKGVLLYGKSGVGKTLIARAIAGEADVPFFQISASAVQSKFVGGTEENIRKLFREAKAAAPSIIFIDEFDSVAIRRYGRYSNVYSASFLNQLLSCMDGFERMNGVMVIAATNHYEQLDDAVLRRGRFDRHIYINEPDKKARKELFEYYAQGKEIKVEDFVDNLLPRTVGFTGSDIKTLMNEAALLAVRNGRTQIEEEDLEESYRKILIGSRSSREETNKNKKRTAVHEAGHALMALWLEQKVMEVSIIPRGRTAGYSLSEIDEDEEITTDEVVKRVKIALAGRAAEKVIFNNVSAGASDDMQKASSYLYDMYFKYGMNKSTDVQLVLTEHEEYNEKIVAQSISCLEDDLNVYYESTLSKLGENKVLILKLAELLYEQEVLTEDDIRAFVTENLIEKESQEDSQVK